METGSKQRRNRPINVNAAEKEKEKEQRNVLNVLVATLHRRWAVHRADLQAQVAEEARRRGTAADMRTLRKMARLDASGRRRPQSVNKSLSPVSMGSASSSSTTTTISGKNRNPKQGQGAFSGGDDSDSDASAAVVESSARALQLLEFDTQWVWLLGNTLATMQVCNPSNQHI